jgi:hypothetical protein
MLLADGRFQQFSLDQTLATTSNEEEIDIHERFVQFGNRVSNFVTLPANYDHTHKVSAAAPFNLLTVPYCYVFLDMTGVYIQYLYRI